MAALLADARGVEHVVGALVAAAAAVANAAGDADVPGRDKSRPWRKLHNREWGATCSKSTTQMIRNSSELQFRFHFRPTTCTHTDEPYEFKLQDGTCFVDAMVQIA